MAFTDGQCTGQKRICSVSTVGLNLRGLNCAIRYEALSDMRMGTRSTHRNQAILERQGSRRMGDP